MKLSPKMLGLGLIFVVAVIAVMALPGPRSWVRHTVRGALGRGNIATLKLEVREEPNNAKTRLALAHALFSEGKREAAIRSYDLALARDNDIGDEKMYENLASCFGTKAQGDAASVITRHKVARIHDRLSALASDVHYKTRWGAVQTLEKIGKASRSDFVRAWIADLDSPDCDVRRRSMEQLGKAGDRHALKAIHHAKKKDQATKKGWLIFSSTCLGDRADEAEKEILAHK